MGYVTITTDVDMRDFEDQELIDEIESRGWIVGEDKNVDPLMLTKDEMQYIMSMLREVNIFHDLQAFEIYHKLLRQFK